MALVTLGVTVVLLTTGKEVFAHCDTLDGPVVGEARMAIEKGDVSPLQEMYTVAGRWAREKSVRKCKMTTRLSSACQMDA